MEKSMKFVHTADWHLGKIVNDHSMLEDQRVVLHRLIDDLKTEKLDAFLISGDLYDRSVPPREAVLLANEIFSRIRQELQVPLLVIAGNHDSPERLHFGSGFYEPTIHIQGMAQSIPYMTEIKGVQFVLLPFVDYPLLAKMYPDESIKSLEDGFVVQYQHLQPLLNKEKPTVLLFHGYISSGSVLESSDSERPLSIGSTEIIDQQLFQPFDYVALGHLHQAQTVQANNIRYSGSILKYSKSEALHQKQVLLVELTETSIEMTIKPLRPLRDLTVKRGTFEALMQESSNDYVYLELLDEHYILDGMNKLQAKYPYAMSLEYINLQSQQKGTRISKQELEQVDLLELFEQFYEIHRQQPLSSDDRTIIEHLIQKQRSQDS